MDSRRFGRKDRETDRVTGNAINSDECACKKKVTKSRWVDSNFAWYEKKCLHMYIADLNVEKSWYNEMQIILTPSVLKSLCLPISYYSVKKDKVKSFP